MSVQNEGTDELREAMSRLSGYPVGSRTVQAFVQAAQDYAAPLLAKVRAVEALHHDFHGWCAGCDFAWPCQTRRALDGER